MAHGKFEVYRDNAGEFRFRLKAANGENVGASGGYTAKTEAFNGIAAVKVSSSDENLFEVFEGQNEKYYFRLKSSNGEVILSSQGYSSESGASGGIDAVKRAATDAQVVEVD